MSDHSRFLRRALQGNAVFSGLSGFTFILAARPIAGFLGNVPTWLMVVIGLSLLGYAAGLFRNAAREHVNLTEAMVAVGMDAAWVVGSLLVVTLADQFGITTGGKWAILLIADVVLVFGTLQFFGLRRLCRAAMA